MSHSYFDRYDDFDELAARRADFDTHAASIARDRARIEGDDAKKSAGPSTAESVASLAQMALEMAGRGVAAGDKPGASSGDIAKGVFNLTPKKDAPKPQPKKAEPFYVAHPYLTVAGGVVGLGLVGTLIYMMVRR